MGTIKAPQSKVSDEAMNNIAGLYSSLLKVHNRLRAEGYNVDKKRKTILKNEKIVVK